MDFKNELKIQSILETSELQSAVWSASMRWRLVTFAFALIIIYLNVYQVLDDARKWAIFLLFIVFYLFGAIISWKDYDKIEINEQKENALSKKLIYYTKNIILIVISMFCEWIILKPLSLETDKLNGIMILVLGVYFNGMIIEWIFLKFKRFYIENRGEKTKYLESKIPVQAKELCSFLTKLTASNIFNCITISVCAGSVLLPSNEKDSVELRVQVREIGNEAANFGNTTVNGIITAANNTYQHIRLTFSPVSEPLSEWWKNTMLPLRPIWDGITSPLIESWNSITSLLIGIWDIITSPLIESWNSITSLLIRIWDIITSTWAWGTIAPPIASVWADLISLIPQTYAIDRIGIAMLLILFFLSVLFEIKKDECIKKLKNGLPLLSYIPFLWPLMLCVLAVVSIYRDPNTQGTKFILLSGIFLGALAIIVAYYLYIFIHQKFKNFEVGKGELKSEPGIAGDYRPYELFGRNTAFLKVMPDNIINVFEIVVDEVYPWQKENCLCYGSHDKRATSIIPVPPIKLHDFVIERDELEPYAEDSCLFIGLNEGRAIPATSGFWMRNGDIEPLSSDVCNHHGSYNEKDISSKTTLILPDFDVGIDEVISWPRSECQLYGRYNAKDIVSRTASIYPPQRCEIDSFNMIIPSILDDCLSHGSYDQETIRAKAELLQPLQKLDVLTDQMAPLMWNDKISQRSYDEKSIISRAMSPQTHKKLSIVGNEIDTWQSNAGLHYGSYYGTWIHSKIVLLHQESEVRAKETKSWQREECLVDKSYDGRDISARIAPHSSEPQIERRKIEPWLKGNCLDQGLYDERLAIAKVAITSPEFKTETSEINFWLNKDCLENGMYNEKKRYTKIFPEYKLR